MSGCSRNEYFIENPKHVLGELKAIDAYGRKLLTCRGDQTAYTTLNDLLKIPKKGEDIENKKQDAPFSDIDAMIKSYDVKIQALLQKKEELEAMKIKLSEFERDLQVDLN